MMKSYLIRLISIVTLWQYLGIAQESNVESFEKERSEFNAKVAEAEVSYEAQFAKLNTQYVVAVDREFQKAVKEGNLDVAAAMKREKEAIISGGERPDSADSEPLQKLQKVYEESHGKLEAERDAKVSNLASGWIERLQLMEVQLTKSAKIDEALAARKWREELQANPALAAKPKATVVGGMATKSLPEASVDKPYENNLGMSFVPVPIVGEEKERTVLFSIWETRVKDYEEFARESDQAGTAWKGLEVNGEKQRDDHPVVNVTWEEAVAFCEWLSRRERGGLVYRLPSDHEWSCAVGIGAVEDPKAEPKSKVAGGENPWADSKFEGNFNQNMSRDKFPFTSPVGSFSSNEFGLFDLAGNAWEWCADWNDSAVEDLRVARGCSYVNYGPYLKPSQRRGSAAGGGPETTGFRVVLDVGE